MRTSLLLPAFAASVVLMFTGCASVSVRDVSQEQASRTQKPNHIYVMAFDVNRAAVKENLTRKRRGALGADAQRLLSGYLVQELNKLGVPASAAPGKVSASPQTWTVSGEITRLHEGSRILRMAIGLGSGGTKMETRVRVTPGGSRSPVLRFATTGGSNAMPGGLTNPVPFSGVPTALLNSKEGVTDDSARTARMIAGTIGEYMANRGWIPKENVPVVKVAQR